MGFEPTRAETNGLTVHNLNHYAFLSIKGVTKLCFCMFLVLSALLIVVVIMCANHSKGFSFEPGQNQLVVIFHDVISRFRGNMQ